MSSRITIITRLLTARRVTEAVDEVVDYETVVSTDVTRTGDTKLFGTVLHISKCKQMTYTRAVGGAKKIKISNSYHRLVFCRYVLMR